MEAICWLVVLIVLLLVEIATLGLTTIWFAGGALVACVAALLHASIWVQIVLFLVVSVLLLLFTRPVAVRYMNKNRTKTNVDSMAGKEAVVTEDIDNLKAQGVVQVNGLEWTARAENNQDVIPKGSVVEVTRVDGVKLIVRNREE